MSYISKKIILILWIQITFMKNLFIYFRLWMEISWFIFSYFLHNRTYRLDLRNNNFSFFLNQLSIILIDIFFFIQTFFLLFRFFFFFSLINFIWICFIFSSSMLSEIKFFLSYLVAQTGHNKFSYLIFS